MERVEEESNTACIQHPLPLDSERSLNVHSLTLTLPPLSMQSIGDEMVTEAVVIVESLVKEREERDIAPLTNSMRGALREMMEKSIEVILTLFPLSKEGPFTTNNPREESPDSDSTDFVAFVVPFNPVNVRESSDVTSIDSVSAECVPVRR